MTEPFEYQNGGQWDWWGGALVEAEFERGHSALARLHLDQIVSRTLRAGPGLHEWYGQDGRPRGSATYAASAASIHNAVVKGLLGVSRSSAGYSVVMRAGETVLPFEVPQRAGAVRLIVSQTVTASAIELSVQANTPIAEVCSVLPQGSVAEDLRARDMAVPQRVRRIGNDTLVCADVSSSPPPVRVRFAIARPQ
jgi:phage tail protein X